MPKILDKSGELTHNCFMQLLLGDCVEVMRGLGVDSVDSVVTDPPYELGFMGKKWDNTGVAYNVEMWKEVYRVLKPGGYLLSFGGTRTYHRMACAIEDAGFEIRDMVEWMYGSGFPKSLNIGKAVDKKPKCDSVKQWKNWLKFQIDNCSKTKKQINNECGFTATSYVKIDNKDYWSSNLPKNGKWQIMKKVIGIATDEYDWVEQDNCEERGHIKPTGGLAGGSGNTVGCFTGKQLSNNAIDERAKQWSGWGTALKPAHEPICMARKPLSEKTVAENVLKWGTGGINIDGCRIPVSNGDRKTYDANMSCHERYADGRDKLGGYDGGWKTNPDAIQNVGARFPANLIHDGSDEVMEMFPNTGNGNGSGPYNYAGKEYNNKDTSMFNGDKPQAPSNFNDSGSAARFFYCAKASKQDRNEGNNHPTVKPTTLMRYLCKLVTPPNGIVLDPFMGSGSTGKAAKLEGFDFIGIEMNEEYFKIAEARMESVKTQKQLFE